MPRSSKKDVNQWAYDIVRKATEPSVAELLERLPVNERRDINGDDVIAALNKAAKTYNKKRRKKR